MTDTEWLKLLQRSVYERSIMGIDFPGFPAPSLQAEFVGSANEDALKEAFAFYVLVKGYASKLGRPLGLGSRLLDFGCGWGRFLRFFWRDVGSEGLYGCDVNSAIVQLCRDLGVPGQIEVIQPLGHLPYRSASFDTIVAYSVFTHLPERVHLHWVRELARVAKPGATFVLTIEPRRFLDFIAKIPQNTSVDWYRRLGTFRDRIPELRRLYDAGAVVFLPTNEGFEETYGDAVIPMAFIEREWRPHFEIVEYIDNPSEFWQAVMVARRR